MKSSYRVVVASNASLPISSEIYRGVADYVAREHLGWQLLPLGHDFETRVTELRLAGAVDGVLGTFVSDRWLEDLTAAGVAAVNLFQLSEIRTVSTVAVDDRAMGAAAARHLVEQGARRFAFIGMRGGFDRRVRFAGFASALPASAGRPVVLELSSALRREVETWVTGEGCLGIFCATDRHARELIQVIRSCGDGELGRDVLVVGVGDDPSEAVFAGIGLSSFSIPAYACGWRAAELMAGHLIGRAEAGGVHRVGGWKLMARESSLRPGRPRMAERLAGFLRDQLDDGELTMDQVARVMGHSRRNLETSFRESFGESPIQWLIGQRVALAKQLLATTGLKIQEVGWRCGFAAQHHFSATFRHHVGCAPREYRKRSRLDDASLGDGKG